MIILSSLLSLALTGELVNATNTYPSMVGGSGNLRSMTALPNAPTTFGVQLLGHFFSADPFLPGRKHSRTGLRVSGNYSFDPGVPLEAFGGFKFSFNESSTAASSQTMTTFFENADLGLKAHLPLELDRLHFAGYAFARAFSGTQSYRNASGGSTKKSGPFMSGQLGFISSFDNSSNTDIPLRADLDIAYRLPNSNLKSVADNFNKIGTDSFKYQAVVASLSGQLLYKYVKPFVELTAEYALFPDSNVKFEDNRKWATVGARATPMESLSVLVAGDINFGGPSASKVVGIPKHPAWEMWFALAFQTEGKKLNFQQGSVRGIVTDEATGMPISNASIQISGNIAPPQQTDGSGYYEFSNLSKGSYQVRVQADGFEPTSRPIQIAEGRDAILDIHIKAAGPKRGTLVASVLEKDSNNPIAGATISVTGLENLLATDKQGRVTLKDLPEGTQNIHVEAPGYQPSDFVAQIFPNESVKQSFYLEKSIPDNGTCAGTVKNPDGTPLTAVFTTEDGKISPFGTDPLSGAFSESLPPGKYTLKVQAENYLPQTVECEVQPGAPTNLTITLEKPKEAVVVENKIILPDALYFEFNSDVIKEESFGILDQVADILKNRNDYEKLFIDGHTDDVGGDAYNKKLSKRRANAVKNYLAKKGVLVKKLESRGFGESKPVATNLTAEGRAENRRVEFNLVRKGE